MTYYTTALLKSDLNQKGFRLTPQRQKILNVFQGLAQGEHLSAEDLHGILKGQGERISLSTVYRTLNLMTRIGILRDVELAEGHKHYEINPPYPNQHHHLVCVQCHRTLEFKNELISKLGLRQADAEKFHMLDCQMTIYGICIEALRQGWPSLLPSSWSCPNSLLEEGLREDMEDEAESG